MLWGFWCLCVVFLIGIGGVCCFEFCFGFCFDLFVELGCGVVFDYGDMIGDSIEVEVLVSVEVGVDYCGVFYDFVWWFFCDDMVFGYYDDLVGDVVDYVYVVFDEQYCYFEFFEIEDVVQE